MAKMTANPNPDLAVDGSPDQVLDPRGIRVGLADASSRPGLDPIVLESPGAPLVPVARAAGLGPLGGTALAGSPSGQVPTAPSTPPLRRRSTLVRTFCAIFTCSALTTTAAASLAVTPPCPLPTSRS